MALALENRATEIKAQADIPGGAASGIDVGLDEDDVMLTGFLAEEGILGGGCNGGDTSEEEESEELQELLDVLEGVEILADDSQQRCVYSCWHLLKSH